MNLTETLQDYFQGEKQLGIGLAVFGTLVLGAALWVWRTQTGAFAGWLLGPLVLIGTSFGVGGTALAVRSQSQITRFTAQLEAEPAKLIAAETIRMAKVNANWPRLIVAWAVITLVALFLLLVVHRDWASALGLSLLVLTTSLFLVDVFAERRAVVYTAALAANAPAHMTPK